MKHFMRKILFSHRETPLWPYALGYFFPSTCLLSCSHGSQHDYLLCLKCNYNSLTASQKQVFEIRKPKVNTVKRDELQNFCSGHSVTLENNLWTGWWPATLVKWQQWPKQGITDYDNTPKKITAVFSLNIKLLNF